MKTLDLSIAKPIKHGATATVPASWGQGRGGRPWRRKRAAILLRDQYACQEIRTVKGKTVKCGACAAEVDHIVPKQRGGSDQTHNLRAICSVCHRAKTQRESQGG